MNPLQNPLRLSTVHGDLLAGGRVTPGSDSIDLYNNVYTFTADDGRVVSMDLGQADVHIDKTLANYAAGYRLPQGAADVASPPAVVPNASDRYQTWNQDDAFQLVQDVQASAGGAVKEVSPRLSNSPFATVGYALQAFIPTEVQANADTPLNPQLQYMRRLMNALLLAREYRVQSLLRTQANHTFTTVLGASAKWNGGASSNPIQDLFTLIENALMPITDIVMSEQVWHDFVQNAAVQKFVASKINVPGIPFVPSDGDPMKNMSSQFTSILGLPKITIAAVKYKTGATAYTYIWGGDVVLLHMPPAGLPRDGSDIAPSYTFRWNGGTTSDAGTGTLVGQPGQAVGGFIVRSFFNPYRGPRGGTQIVVLHNDAEVMTSSFVSGLIVGAHQ